MWLKQFREYVESTFLRKQLDFNSHSVQLYISEMRVVVPVDQILLFYYTSAVLKEKTIIDVHSNVHQCSGETD